MLSGRGLCNELITRPEESYRSRNLKNVETLARVGLLCQKKNQRSDKCRDNSVSITTRPLAVHEESFSTVSRQLDLGSVPWDKVVGV